MILHCILVCFLTQPWTSQSNEMVDNEEDRYGKTSVTDRTESSELGEVPIAVAKCGGSVAVGGKENLIYHLNSPFTKANSNVYPPGNNCSWMFAGGPNCTVELTCTNFSLYQTDGGECTQKDDRLEVSDGTGGFERYCGNTTFPKPIVASKGLQDLFIKFKATRAEGTIRTGFQCTVRCSVDPRKAKQLRTVVNQTECSKCVCGQQETKRTKRTVSGNETGLNQWPWQVALVKAGSRKAFCAGTILNSRFILTAAHCTFFEKTQPNQVEILVRATQLDRTDRKDLRQRTPERETTATYKDKLKKGADNQTLLDVGTPLQKPTVSPNVSTTVPPTVPRLENGSATSIEKPSLTNVNNVEDTPAPTRNPSTTEFKPPKPTLPGKVLIGIQPIRAAGKRRARSAGKPGNNNSTQNDKNAGAVVLNVTATEHSRRYKVKRIINHPLFNSNYDFDVSLLEVIGDIDLDLDSNNEITSICLPPLGNKSLFWDQQGTVVGWGLTREQANFTDGTLRQLKVNVMDNKLCQNLTEYEITPRMMCAGFEKGEKDVCLGDSGGPLNFINTNNQWMQIGIVSWGEGCAKPEKPSVFTRVTQLQQWILYHTLRKGKWCKSVSD